MTEKGGFGLLSLFSMLSRIYKPFLLLCILGVAVACYLPGMSNHFIFDDGVNIAQNTSIQIENLNPASLWQAATSGNAGPLKRPLSMLSFALDYYVSGLSAAHFKMTNLGIHLVNGMLVFILCGLLLNLYHRIHQIALNDDSSFWISAAVSAIWLVHPFNLTGVLYVVQRMTSLSALFTLVGLVLYLYGRKCLLNGNRSGFIAVAASIFVATPLAALSKENGALLPLLILLMEITLLRWRAPGQTTRHVLVTTVGLTAVMPVLIGVFYILYNPGLITGGYLMRDFSLTERLMTEARVMWFYMHMILLPNMAMMGLHHDDILISKSLFSPLSTAPSIVGLLLLAAGAFVLRNKHPILAFGASFFLMGHVLESSVIPLEIAFEHRNYLPMFGILLPLTYYSLSPQFHPSSLRLRRASFLMLIILFASLTATRAHQWGDPLQMRMLEVQRHPHSVRANTDMAALYDHMPARAPEEAIDFYSKAIYHYQQAAEISSSNTSGLFGLLVVNAERGMQVSSTLVDTLEGRLATVPFNPPNVNAIIGTARCIKSEKCIVSPEIIDRLYRAALSNPTLTGNYRSQVVSEFGELIENTEK